MCGIAGGWCERLTPEALDEALCAIRHRGPDDQGTLHQGPIHLGMRRLSIIDLETGHQPIANEDQSVHVVFNGEIYNYVELVEALKERHSFRTSSDTETLVHLYEDRGVAMCEPLRGMYGFAIWDANEGQLFLGRDRYGKKPLFWSRTPSGGLIFASELKALRVLARAVGLSLEINEQGVYDYLSFGFIPQPDTIYKGVFWVPAGHWLRFDGKDVTVRSYWKPEFLPKLTISYEDALEEARRLLAEAVRIRLRSDVPVGVFLSGGVDSSIVTYETMQQKGQSVRAFTVSVEDQELDESPVAKRTAAYLGAAIEVMPMKIEPLEELLRVVRSYDQPYADSSAIPSMAIARLARQHVKVVLTGDGGDEVFSGYRRYLAAHFSRYVRWIPSLVPRLAEATLQRLPLKRRSGLGFAQRFARGLSLPQAKQYIFWTSDMLVDEDKQAIWRGGAVSPTETWLDGIFHPSLTGADEMQCNDINVTMLNAQLTKVDIATMAASLEARSPFLDHKVGEFAMRLPASYRLRRGLLKSILREGYEGRLPHEVLRGKKRGFEIPMASWLQHDFRPLLQDTLAQPDARVGQFVDLAYVKNLLDGTIMQERNTAYLQYSLLVLEMWLREHEATS